MKSFFKDEAAALLTYIPITESNYLKAWHKLVHRHNKCGHIANLIVESFLYINTFIQPCRKPLHEMQDKADEVICGLRVRRSHF